MLKPYIYIYISYISTKYIYAYDFIQYDINDAKILNTKRAKDNLTKLEQKALEELSKRDDISITNTDKGGAIVIDSSHSRKN